MEMMKGNLFVDETMSNLTSTSGEISASTTDVQAPPPKKKRSLPGHPDPDAEVIALSPKTLMATNRFTCEICNKGFQRDQNLQLHKRGHNLPWKLKQRDKQEVVRKKVYVCPEPSCVHHEPARALGDLTGIKKHFCRKHGEKKWKCEKCSKRYAVQSDWKAHSKICGTREYRCDCGTLFSRRDSFITHRAFCDALAEESARAITAATTNPPLSHMNITSSTDLQPQLHSHGGGGLQYSLSAVKREQQQQQHVFNARSMIPAADTIPPWLACPHPLAVQTQNPSQHPSLLSLPPFQAPLTEASPHMSATALLQKAAQMGVTMSNKPLQSPAAAAMQRPPRMSELPSLATTSSTTAAAGLSGLQGLCSREELGSGSFQHGLASFGNKAAASSVASAMVADEEAPSLLHDMMMISSLSSSSPSGFDAPTSSFEQSFNGVFNTKVPVNSNFTDKTTTLTDQSQLSCSNNEGRAGSSSVSSSNVGIGNNDGLTRDFLGLQAFPHRSDNFPNLVAGLNRINTSSSSSSSSAYRQQSQQTRSPWQG